MITVYTAIFGNVDTLAPVPERFRFCDVRYVCFSDQPREAAGWDVQVVKSPLPGMQRRLSRWYKLHPHALFTGPTVWIDGCCSIRGDFRRQIEQSPDLACFPHPRRGDIFEEAVPASKRSADGAAVLAEVDRYKRDGHPAGFGLWACTVLFRKPNINQVRFDELWWRLYQHGGDRDQISFAEAVRRTNHFPELLPGSRERNRYFAVHPHRPPTSDLRLPTRRWDLFNLLIKKRGWTSYLEIGCRDDHTFRRVDCPFKTGVDPKSGGTLRMTSDAFFESIADREDLLYDLVFVDGLHHWRQALRDVMNSVSHLAPGGLIVMHDCLPANEAEQRVLDWDGNLIFAPPDGKPWCGDVWKAAANLRAADFDVCVYNADHGLGLLFDRPNTSPLPAEWRDIGFAWEPEWWFYRAHRDELLRVVDWDGARAFLGLH